MRRHPPARFLTPPALVVADALTDPPQFLLWLSEPYGCGAGCAAAPSTAVAGLTSLRSTIAASYRHARPLQTIPPLADQQQEAFKVKEAEVMAKSEAAWKEYQKARGEGACVIIHYVITVALIVVIVTAPCDRYEALPRCRLQEINEGLEVASWACARTHAPISHPPVPLIIGNTAP